ncbi:MAG: hypothetical protein RLP14_08575 [Owenweeksia sp.]
MCTAFNIRWFGFALCFAAFAVLQFQFVEADPSIDISHSRGPFTDEGLNTSQARNYINHGSWGLAECDNLVKSPAFNLYMAGVFHLFDTSRQSARLAVLIASLLLFLIFSFLLNKPLISVSLILIGGMHYQFFQFFHFAMVEVMAVQLILASLAAGFIFLKRSDSVKNSWFWLVLHFVGLFTVVCLKVQFAYTMVFPLLLIFLCKLHTNNSRFKPYIITLFGLYAAAILFYGFGWYVHVQPVFDKVIAGQVTHRYSGDWNGLKALAGNIRTFFLRPENLCLNLFFALSLISVIRNRNTLKLEEKYLFSLAGIWLLLEYHKVFIQWVPARYTLSLVFALALWNAVFTYSAFKSAHLSGKLLALVILVLTVILHSSGLTRLMTERTYRSAEIINHFEKYDFKGRAVAGTWATGLIWTKTAYVLPVWDDFTPMEEFMETYKPVLVVTEKHEKDSDRAFDRQGIDLQHYYSQKEERSYGGYTLFFYSDSMASLP